MFFFSQPCIIACDAQCNKAWGINNRERVYLSENEDDFAFLADSELGEAPVDPGTYEGGHAKPTTPDERLNKWCARECERGIMIAEGAPIELADFSQRFYNIPR